jgi:cyclophilin family peptidyl-prolyl cis-trans isomerase
MNYNRFGINIFYFLGLLLFTSCAKPIASFIIDAKEKSAPAKIKFDNQSQKATKYFWDFGDGTTSEEIAPFHRYLVSGKYTIKLKASKGSKMNTMEQEIIIDAPRDCLVEMETSLGSLTLKLSDLTPLHRDNFLKLAETNYFDGILFHRVINGFMVQAGDPNSKNAKPNQRLGAGGPDYTVPAEFVNDLVHTKGALSAARQGDDVNPSKNSSGSQFYIVHGRPVPESSLELIETQKSYKLSKENKDLYTNLGGTPALDKEYTVFGHVIKGLEIVDKIATVKTDGSDRPVEDVKILKVRIIK